MSSVPSQVVIRCTADAAPLPGAYVIVSLPMWAKNQYALLFGPSDERGIISVSGGELTSGARADQDLFPMDYVSFPEEWSGGIGAEVLNATGVHRLREAIRTWGDDHVPPQLVTDLDAYEERISQLSGRKLTAEVAHTG